MSRMKNSNQRAGYKYMGLAGGLQYLIWITIAIIIIIVVLTFLLHLLFILTITVTGAEGVIVNTYEGISAILCSVSS
jgi:hypothetical protein